MSRLKDLYKDEIVDAMIKKFGYKNIMEGPKLDKIVVNMGVGEAKENAKLLEKAFYNGRGAEPEAEVKRKQIAMVDQMNAMGFDPLQLAKVLSNPDMVKMLQMLAGSGAAT